jgi:hypothetical protein
LIWIYCQTTDDPKEVGEHICKSNLSRENSFFEFRVMKDEEDCWLITTNPNETSAMVYRIGDEILVIEIDDDCAPTAIELLLKKYGFANVKWLQSK